MSDYQNIDNEFNTEQYEIVELFDFYLKMLIALSNDQSIIRTYSHSELREKKNECVVQLIKLYLDSIYSLNSDADFSMLNDDILNKEKEIWLPLDTFNVALNTSIYFVFKTKWSIDHDIKVFSIMYKNIEIFNTDLGCVPFAVIFEKVYQDWFKEDEKKVWGMFNNLNKNFFLN